MTDSWKDAPPWTRERAEDLLRLCATRVRKDIPGTTHFTLCIFKEAIGALGGLTQEPIAPGMHMTDHTYIGTYYLDGDRFDIWSQS